MSRLLQELMASRKQAGAVRGIYSVCNAHPWVLCASVRQAKQNGMPLLIEATSNQVNQHGGYTGMQPKDFRALLEGIAAEEGFSPERLILGGDHLEHLEVTAWAAAEKTLRVHREVFPRSRL